MYIIVPQEKRKDTAYWSRSFPDRLYYRLMLCITTMMYGALFFGWICPVVEIQWTLSVACGLFALFFRTIYPNGFGKLDPARMSTETTVAKQELSEGNMDGVPNWLQNVMKYPDPEEIRQREEKAQQAREEFEAIKAARKAEKEARKQNRRK